MRHRCRPAINLLARDAVTGRIGTFQTALNIPNLNRETTRVPTSSVVLSSQRVPLGEALHTVKRKVNADAVNPPVWDGHRLVPSVTRVFSASREFHVFLQAYQRGAAAQRPLVAFVTFLDGAAKVFESAPLAIADGIDACYAVPLRFTLDRAGIEPGAYDCQVTVLDPEGQKVAFWRAPVVVP